MCRHRAEIERIYGAMLSTMDRDLTLGEAGLPGQIYDGQLRSLPCLRAMRRLILRLSLPLRRKETEVISASPCGGYGKAGKSADRPDRTAALADGGLVLSGGTHG